MNRKDQVDVVAAGNLREGFADSREPVPEALAPVRGDEDQTFSRKFKRGTRGDQLTSLEAVANLENCIDTGIARDPHVFGNAFAPKIIGCPGRGREVQVGHPGRENTIELLGERLAEISGAQSRFDMRHGNAAVEGGEGAAQSRSGVPLHDRQIGLRFREGPLQGLDDSRRRLEQGLPWGHHVQIVIRRYAEGR